MGNWSWSGILLIVAIFLLLLGIVLAFIEVENPLTGQESSIIEWLIDIIVDAITPF